MSLEGRAFLRLLTTEVAVNLPRLPNFQAAWNSSRDWTTFMLGSGETRSAGDFGVLGIMAASLGYRVEAEYLRVDQIWYSHHKDKEDWEIDVFIEHENDDSRLAETVRKCLQLAQGTKVVITYPDRHGELQLREIAQTIVKNRYGVSPDARLLLILGFLEQKTLRWKGFEIDGLGREVAIEAMRT